MNKEMNLYETPVIETIEIEVKDSIAATSTCPLENESVGCPENQPECEDD